MQVLLTGSSGFIGGKLIEPLREEGCEVVGLDRAPPGDPAPDRHIQADILDPGVAERALEGIDCVFHLAAAKDDWGISEEGYFRDNTEATRHLVEAGRDARVKRWVFFSSVAALGPSAAPQERDTSLDPVNPYGKSKAAAEEVFRRYAANVVGSAVVVVRPSVVYGPGNPPNTNVYRLIDAIHNNRFVMVGDGQTVKSTSYIENLVAATTFLFRRMDAGFETIVYVDEPVMTNEEIVDLIYRCLGRSRSGSRVPLWLARRLGTVGDVLARVLGVDFPITGARIRKFCRATHYDASRIRNMGFEQPIDNETAMARTVRDYLEETGS